MAELSWRTGLYLRLIGARIRSQAQYRLSFALDILGAFLISFIDFLAVVVIFAHLSRLAGWSLAEVAFFYGTASVSFALTDLAVGHLDLLPAMIKTGSFDLILVRPVGSLFQVLSSDVQMRRLGRAAQGLAVLFYALAALSISWTVPRAVMLVVMIAAGVGIYAGVWIMALTVTFWAVEVREIANAFTYGGSFLASYPINIFGLWFRRLLAFVIPMAFVSYFPGLYILGRSDPLGTPGILRFLTPLVALIMLLLATRVWRFGVRHYRSTGS